MAIVLDSAEAKQGYLVQTLRIGSLILGIAIEPDLNLTATIYTILLLCGFGLVGVFALIDFIYILKDTERTEAMYTANASFAVITIFLLSKFNRKPLLRLYYLIIENYQQSSAFARISDELFIRVVRKYRILVVLIYLLVILTPLVITFTTDVEAGDNKSLIFPSWYPWNMSTPIGYFFTMVVQLLSVTSGYSILAAVFGCLLSCLVTIFTLIELLKKRLNCLYAAILNARLRSSCVEPAKTFQFTLDNYEVHRILSEFVKEHRALMRFTNETVGYFSVCSIMVAEASFVTSIFLISIFISIDGEYLYKVKLISASLFVTVASFTYCLAGEMLFEVNQNIKEIIYEMPWYSQDVKMKKIFYTFLLLSEKKFELRAYKMSRVRLNFFLYLMRICYSAIQVLAKY